MDEKKAKNHVTLVAVLHICFGALSIFGAIIILIALNFAGNFVPSDEQVARNVLQIIGSIIPTIVAFFGLVDLIAGATLFSYKKWARIFVIIVSAISCLNIPIGTAKGVYSIWALMQPDIEKHFN